MLAGIKQLRRNKGKKSQDTGGRPKVCGNTRGQYGETWEHNDLGRTEATRRNLTAKKPSI